MTQGKPIEGRLSDILRTLLVPLVLSGLAELLLNRTVSRATIFIPKTELIQEILAGLSSLGLFLLALAFLLAVVWLSTWAVRSLMRSTDGAVGTLLPALLLFLSILGLAAVLGPGAPVAIAFASVFLATVTLLVARSLNQDLPRRLFVLAVGVAYELFAIWLVLSQIESLWNDLQLGAAEELPRLGEIAALLASAFLFWAESRTGDGKLALTTRTSLLAAVPTALFAFLVTLNRALIANISIWSVGFSLFLPWPIYPAAIWLFAAGILGAQKRGRRRQVIGYLVILIAGYNLSLTYTYVLAVIALVLLLPGDESLTRSDRSGSRPRPLAPESDP